MLRDDYKVQGNKSLDRAERAIRNLGDFFGLSRVLDITTDQITRYIVARQEVQIAPATTAYELAILKRMFTVAIKAEKLDRRPHIPHIEVRNVRSSFFSESEFRKVLTFLHADVQPVVEFCYLTGWWIGEVQPLRWTQIDWNEKTIRLQPGTTRNDEGRISKPRSSPLGALQLWNHSYCASVNERRRWSAPLRRSCPGSSTETDAQSRASVRVAKGVRDCRCSWPVGA